MPIKDIINQVIGAVFTMESTLTVDDAIHLMLEKGTAGIIVVKDDRPAGIFTEKDVVSCYAKFGRRPFSEILLKDAMTEKLIVATPEDEIEASISLMVKAHITHLPVVEDGKIIALLGLCDLVQHRIGTLSSELHYLEEYLNDLHEAGKD